jgi:ribonuclease BN (tRNA processing enzyme)
MNKRAWMVLSLIAALSALRAAEPSPAAAAAASLHACRGRGAELQVLGSGGPELSDHRASSSYLVWTEGRPRVLVDIGGGSALRFAEAGAHVAQLEAIVLSHLHIDHVGDLAPLMMSAYFEDRRRPLPIFGPGGNDVAPPTSELVRDLFGPHRGAFRYLGSYLRGDDGGFKFEAHDVVPKGRDISVVLSKGDLELAAVRVTHGEIPALAWRVKVGATVFAFSGDTSGTDGSLEGLARNVDILVMHNAVPEGSGGALTALHMAPSTIGRIAHAARAKSVVLSHRMNRTLGMEGETGRAIALNYSGPIAFANDLDCFDPPGGGALSRPP